MCILTTKLVCILSAKSGPISSELSNSSVFPDDKTHKRHEKGPRQ